MSPRMSGTDLTEAERLVRARAGDEPFDFEAMSCVANMYRAATAFRNRVERELLSEYDLSWSGFTTLFVLWVWGPTGANQLASDVGVNNATLTGIVSTLIKRELVDRSVPESDRRKLVLTLTDKGTELIGEVFPRFHAYEVSVTSSIPSGQQRIVSEALRTIIAWGEGSDDPTPTAAPTPVSAQDAEVDVRETADAIGTSASRF